TRACSPRLTRVSASRCRPGPTNYFFPRAFPGTSIATREVPLPLGELFVKKEHDHEENSASNCNRVARFLRYCAGTRRHRRPERVRLDEHPGRGAVLHSLRRAG